MVSIETAAPEDTAGLNRTLLAAFNAASIDDFGVEGVIPPGVDDGSMVATAFEEQTIYSIRHEDRIIGGIIVEEREPNEMFLQTLWVDPEHQRMQVGSEAMAFLEEAYPDVAAWTLETPKASDRNRHFYEKHGYRIVGEEGTEGEDVVLLTYRKEMR